jgi:hypothetical protein
MENEVNRQQGRAAERRNRKARERVQRPNYDPANDPKVHQGIANIVRSIDLERPGGVVRGGKCLFRTLVALEAMRHCDIEGRLELGSMLYRVGPEPMRDVVAFCGPGNAGGTFYGQEAFHVWVAVGNSIADFSVSDWPALSAADIVFPGVPDIGPIQWTIPQPRPGAFWWKPRSELIGRWRATGTPELGEAGTGRITATCCAFGRTFARYRRSVSPRSCGRWKV